MKIVLIYVGELLHCPPAMSVGAALNDMDIDIKFITFNDDTQAFKEYFRNKNNIEFCDIGKSNLNKSFIYKSLDLYFLHKKIWDYIDKFYDSNTLIWIISNGSLKYLGNKILKYNYILHLLELNEELYYIESKHILPMSRVYAKKAKCIIECEYNRAHITKAWWELDRIPNVLCNKPYDNYLITKKSSITSDVNNKITIESLRKKKIILYQGNISKERPLQPFYDAVKKLGKDFVLVAMTNGGNPMDLKTECQYYHIPFVNPPFHLEITSHAYIGILSYIPIKNSYSILNTLYCAPNKIWEYARFGIPMIGNDVPALKNHFDIHKDGLVIDLNNTESIYNAIRAIDKEYSYFSNKSLEFYSKYNFREEVNKILLSANNDR